MAKSLADYVGEALHEAGNYETPCLVVLAFLEELEDYYTGDMEIEHAVCWLTDAVRKELR